MCELTLNTKQKIRELVIPKILHTMETGADWSENDFHFPLEDLIYVIEDTTDLKFQDFDTNSVHWDWWAYFTINDDKYTLSGSGWYGGLTFGR